MKILYVSNSINNSGAPKVLGLIIRKSKELFGLNDGLLIAPFDSYYDTKATVLIKCDYFIDQTLSFEERVNQAESIIKKNNIDFVFVNTMRVGYFLNAAKNLNLPCIAYFHEMGESQINFLNGGFINFDSTLKCDLVMWAAKTALLDWSGMDPNFDDKYHKILEPCVTNKNLVDSSIDEKNIQRQNQILEYVASLGCPPVVAIGTACARKGFDRFIDLSKLNLRIPFIWVGGFDKNSSDAKIYTEKIKGCKNLYLTGEIPEPWDKIPKSSLLIFIPREDPNPLTIFEALSKDLNILIIEEGLGEVEKFVNKGFMLKQYDENSISQIINFYIKNHSKYENIKLMESRTEVEFFNDLKKFIIKK